VSTNESYGPADRVRATRPSEIVVGIDDSPSAQSALRWAAEQSRITGAPLRVVHAWQMSATASAAVVAGAAEYWEAASADARARATRWVLDTLGGGAAEVRWSLEVCEGAPGPVLVDVAHGAKLLVVGTREHTGLRRAVTGSVSHYCLSHADAAVVAVPPPTEQKPPADTGRGAMTSPGPLL
jgi:nucleotide-binding universal stress UspA family protein